MKIMKSVLALVMALCLMMCLAVPALATSEPDTTQAATGASTENTEATTGDTATGDTATGDTSDTTTDESAPTEEETGSEETESEEAGAEETTTTGTNGAGTEDKNKVLRTILLILEVIASVALIVVVLLQSGKESGLGNTISGNSDSYMNKNKKGGMDKMLASATKWVALAWIVFTLLLGLI